ncbi:MAG: cysteine--tRNA ligase [Candidatus Zambryskibacteria bacterium]|nr:cysteine--tRNA ligase [Candidatus Zambryskibacteria bacterium]
MTIRLHNTLSGKLEEFSPIEPNRVKMYHCGPTVYGTQHIGNLSMFVFTDILRRTLEYSGFQTKQVINITDFGHLTSDADEGEDKMTKGLKREGLEMTLDNMLTLGRKYAGVFLEDISRLNVKTEGTFFPYASEYVPQQIEMIKILESKGFTYKTSDGIYFDISKCREYGKLGGLSQDLQARIAPNPEKKNQRDFNLWKFNPKLGWKSPWGEGFPGWHIECSTMIINLLGEQIDIHTGGIEHIPVHHNNEIAQSEAATGKEPFARYWLHRAHLQLGGEKIAKSEGNVVYLSEIIEKGFSPLAFRYFLLNSTYRTSTNFTWEALEAAQNAYKKLKEAMTGKQDLGIIDQKYKKQFIEKIEDDLNTPEALAVVWKLVKDESVSSADKHSTLLDFDKVLGLNLEQNEFETGEIPEEVSKLLSEREEARASGDYQKSDKLREEIKKLDFIVEDTPSGQKVLKL